MPPPPFFCPRHKKNTPAPLPRRGKGVCLQCQAKGNPIESCKAQLRDFHPGSFFAPPHIYIRIRRLPFPLDYQLLSGNPLVWRQREMAAVLLSACNAKLKVLCKVSQSPPPPHWGQRHAPQTFPPGALAHPDLIRMFAVLSIMRRATKFANHLPLAFLLAKRHRTEFRPPCRALMRRLPVSGG